MLQASRSTHNLRFVAICLLMFAGGGYLRVRSGWLALPTAAAATPAPATVVAVVPTTAPVEVGAPSPAPADSRGVTGTLPAATAPAAPTRGAPTTGIPAVLAPAPVAPPAAAPSAAMQAAMGDVVTKFYTLITHGKFDDAYKLVLEADFAYVSRGTYRLLGLAGMKEVNSELSAAFGVNGEKIKIINMGVNSVVPLPAEKRDPDQRPELYALEFLPPGLSVVQIYDLELGGALIEICGPWSWHKSLLIAALSDGSYKMLFARHPQGRQEEYQDYFADENMYLGSTILRGQ